MMRLRGLKPLLFPLLEWERGFARNEDCAERAFADGTLQLIAEEAAALGVVRLAIITAPNKQELCGIFGAFPELVQNLEARVLRAQSERVQRANSLLNPNAVEQ